MRSRLAAVTLVAAPAVVGAVAALVIGLRSSTLDLVVRTSLWSAVLGAGLIGSAVLAVPVLLRWRTARAWSRGTEAAVRAATEDHHRFLLRLDHELKNPVTAMQAGLANVAAQVDDHRSPEAAAALASVSAQTRRLAALVADLRKLAELETRPIERSPVDLAALLAELLAEIRDAAGPEGRTLTLTLPQAPWPLATVSGDRDLLSVAFYNLLANAVKFTRTGDTIEVRARDDGTAVVVEVADTGIGIPTDEVGQVWEELSRGRAARGTPGMGLGLALVRAVVARHGGTVSVRSREGHGTVVALRLPAAGPS